MKTEQEILEADEREREIEAGKVVADEAAYLEFSKATKEAFEEYISVWHPAKEKWEAFSQPYFEKLRIKLANNNKAEAEAVSEIRANWQKCPQCGTPASRYQVFCSDEKCGVNLTTFVKEQDKPVEG